LLFVKGKDILYLCPIFVIMIMGMVWYGIILTFIQEYQMNFNLFKDNLTVAYLFTYK
jgi:hypothetical protein